MIAREELELLISGAVSQAALGIESANGRRLTTTEIERMNLAIATAMRMVADRCGAARVPPPPPAPRAHSKAGWFNPLRTAELPRVTDEAIKKAGG
jgi:hypothetical protein